MDLGSYQLTEKFKGLDWFSTVGEDPHGRLVVYVKYMSLDVLNRVPDVCNGKQVLCHFASTLLGSPAKVVANRLTTVEPEIPVFVVEEEDASLPLIEVDLTALAKDLERLEKVCGSNVLQDIFYEVHDGVNAVTNLSSKHPAVRAELNRLYEEYGFDVIYEELDG